MIKQILAHYGYVKRNVLSVQPGEFYGGVFTIHSGRHLDIEVYKGKVISVWYRCKELPFRQYEVDKSRVREYEGFTPQQGILGIQLESFKDVELTQDER